MSVLINMFFKTLIGHNYFKHFPNNAIVFIGGVKNKQKKQQTKALQKKTKN